jgi:hypothetical protein
MGGGYNHHIAMRPNPQDVASPHPADLRDKALNLREAVNSSRARMNAQNERLARLRREISELRQLVEMTESARPAPVAVSVPIAPAAPIVKKVAPVSAAATASFTMGTRANGWKPVPYIAIFFFAVGMQLNATRRAAHAPAAPVAPIAPAATVAAAASQDDGADEALMLTHDWRLPGDERSLSERLGSDTNPPGTQPEWTADRTGERTYRVSFRPHPDELGYQFDVDLDARRVEPTPETSALIAPRLVTRR